MTISSIFAALAAAFAHVQVDAPAAVTKLQQVQAGLESASAVVSILPDSKAKTDATEALNVAGVIAAEAIVVAHTVAGTPGVAAPEVGAGVSSAG